MGALTMVNEVIVGWEALTMVNEVIVRWEVLTMVKGHCGMGGADRGE